MSKKKKVLIVEDEVIHALSLQMFLTNKGYDTCKIMTKGENAILAADEDNPDIVIMDINLAGQMDGFKTAEMIKTKHEIPIIFLTGYSDKNIIQKADSFSDSVCLKKPTSPDRVYFEIEKLFNGS